MGSDTFRHEAGVHSALSWDLHILPSPKKPSTDAALPILPPSWC